MRKSQISSLFLLLLLSIVIPQLLPAADLVALKNLSWEEQQNKTRIILETSQPLTYQVLNSSNPTEVLIELGNLDLRNLPQELFINTNEILSLQTFPQSDAQKARMLVKLSAHRPHQIVTEGSKLFIDVHGNPQGEGGLAPVTKVLPPQTEQTEATAEMASVTMSGTEEPAATEQQELATPAEETAVPMTPEPVAASMQEATVVQDVRVSPVDSEKVDVVLEGDGAFRYDIFELSNPQRIVIDLKSVTMAPSVHNMMTGEQALFSKIRVAQYQTAPRVVRAVIDLTRKVPYSVSTEGNELRIHLGQTGPQVKPASHSIQEQGEQIPVDEMAAQSVVAEQNDIVDVNPVASDDLVANLAAPSNAAMNNEQFFSFKPDTSVFAQEPTETPATPPTTEQETTGTGQGMGTFQDRTVRSGAERQYTGEPFSFDFKDIDIKDLFRFIADISGLNVILDPTVSGSVTLKLTEVPWDQALDLITKNQGLGYTIEGNVIRIAPLNKIKEEERARLEVERQKLLAAPLVTKIKPLSYARATEIQNVVRRVLTAKGNVLIDARTNTLIITDIDTNIDSVINLVETLDTRTAQVVIEARIVETTKNFSQAFGIQWGFRGIVDPAFGNNTTLQFPNNMLFDGSTLISQQGISGNPLSGYAINLPTTAAPNSAILLSAGNILDTFRLDVALMALENTGNGRILSSPKVATQNNTRAEILQGTQIPVQTVANNTITTTFVNAALRMSVTPQITAEGTVIMDVIVENNRPDFANIVFGTPPIITERAQTTLLVEDGGTTVIGGIFTASDNYAQGRTPVLHRIPLLGWLFKNTNVTRENRELLIFLTPRILR